jgi:hypothetical protein
MITVSLIDDSLPLPEEGDQPGHPITLVLFCKEKEKLPQIQRIGDILRMHRVFLQVSRMVCHLFIHV